MSVIFSLTWFNLCWRWREIQLMPKGNVPYPMKVITVYAWHSFPPRKKVSWGVLWGVWPLPIQWLSPLRASTGSHPNLSMLANVVLHRCTYLMHVGTWKTAGTTKVHGVAMDSPSPGASSGRLDPWILLEQCLGRHSTSAAQPKPGDSRLQGDSEIESMSSWKSWDGNDSSVKS